MAWRRRVAKNNAEVIRIQNSSARMLETMSDVTRVCKGRLASYAIWLLEIEFDKWKKGDPTTRFGYSHEMKDFNFRRRKSDDL